MKRPDLTNPLYARFLDFKPRKRDIRKATILEATIECIATIGVENTSFDSVGKRAEMIKAHVAYYFPNRNLLIEDALKFAIATVQSVTVEFVVAEPDPEKHLPAFVRGTFAWLERYPKQASAILLLYYYGSFDKNYRKLHTQVRNLGYERLQAIVAFTFPKTKKGADGAKRYAKYIQNIMTGNIVDFLTADGEISLGELLETTLSDLQQARAHY
jgi:AcrR family transcriptional regulator